MIRRLLQALGPAAGRLRGLLVLLAVCGVLQGIGFVLLVPLLSALLDGNTSTAWRWLGVEAAVVAAYAAVHFAAQLLGYRTAIAMSEGLFRRLGDQIARLPIGWFAPERVGSVGRLSSTGVLNIMGVPAHHLRPLVYAFVTPATVVVGMFVYDWRLALAACAAGPIAALAFRFAGRLIERNEVALEASQVEVATRLVEYARAQVVVRAYSSGASARTSADVGGSLLDESFVAHHATNRRFLLRGVIGIIVFSTVVHAMFTVLVVVGVGLAVDGSVVAAELIAVLVLAARFVGPMTEAAELGGMLRMANASLGRMNDILTTATLPEPPFDPDDALDGPAAGAVCVEGVTFWYGSGREPTVEPAVRDVSFSVAPRSMTAIVGPSGSGKTTLTRLIARFWDVGAGVIRVGGHDVRDLTSATLMRQLSFVFQDVYLFDGTIEENVRMGDPRASDEAVAAAMRLARVDEIVDRLPAGPATRVGEGGAALSGGERQRVSIARALLKDAPIVLLDEATSALDPENEALVQQALGALTADRTLIVIAHRLQTIQHADQIVVLDSTGHVAEIGTHDELLSRGGRYTAFWAERSRAAGWRLRPAAAQ